MRPGPEPLHQANLAPHALPPAGGACGRALSGKASAVCYPRILMQHRGSTGFQTKQINRSHTTSSRPNSLRLIRAFCPAKKTVQRRGGVKVSCTPEPMVLLKIFVLKFAICGLLFPGCACHRVFFAGWRPFHSSPPCNRGKKNAHRHSALWR